mmetsp:Transcript_7050/g.9792  ORF Transcript_7050/g.9792 Transcript_7050/m.9792 type:complete len:88 (+) Transcript_7050:1108-1371(+)
MHFRRQNGTLDRGSFQASFSLCSECYASSMESADLASRFASLQKIILSEKLSECASSEFSVDIQSIFLEYTSPGYLVTSCARALSVS